MTEILHNNASDLAKAKDIITSGGTVVFPTETVYGLGANALDVDAISKIFAAKGRPSDNPLIVHIAETKDIVKYVEEIPEIAQKLIDAFMPGPLTIIFKKKTCIPDVVTAGFDSVGIRVPKHDIAHNFLKTVNLPVAAPSANTSGKPSPTKAKHVIHDLQGKVDAIIEGGDSDVGLESTVIDVTKLVPVLLRPGAVTKEQLEAVIGRILVPEDVGKYKTLSPGMKYTHYKPHAEVVLIECTNYTEKRIEDMKKILLQYQKEDKKIALITLRQNNLFNISHVKRVNSNEDYAQSLFAYFRECDANDIDVLFVESVETDDLGLAIMNRIRKAATRSIKL
ncbi:MAG: L-threonylcarbamoyladenylate synthase [Candidatus Woesearchaeota archaeon]